MKKTTKKEKKPSPPKTILVGYYSDDWAGEWGEIIDQEDLQFQDDGTIVATYELKETKRVVTTTELV